LQAAVGYDYAGVGNVRPVGRDFIARFWTTFGIRARAADRKRQPRRHKEGTKVPASGSAQDKI
jgi:hypothetical protein